jgi:hypothetical protein
MVHKRARQFESGKPLPEDDPSVSDRTSLFKSELARITVKQVVPNVTERAQEYEIRSVEPKRETPTTSTPKKIQRDARSLESNGKLVQCCRYGCTDFGEESTSSSSSISMSEVIAKRLSGNVMISTGSKYIHCPPPSEYGKPTG